MKHAKINEEAFAAPRATLGAALIALTIAAYPALLFLETETLLDVGREDGVIESLGAALYALASAMMVVCFTRSRGGDNRFFGRPTSHNIYFLLLAIFFFVCAGEEISWGQRLLGWRTPEAWSAVNAQGETNFHNIWLFQATNPDGSKKSELELMLYPGRIVFAIALLYCVVVPLLYASSIHFRRFFKYAGLPIPFIFSGVLFLLAYAKRKFLIASVEITPDTARVLGETQETLFAMGFTVMAAYFFRSEAKEAATRKIWRT